MSIFDGRDTVATPPSWRCPHCGQLQSEASRCWRCGRSAVTCSTCHRFRPAVADALGYCAADRARTPLSGDEIEPCWEAVAVTPTANGLFDALEMGSVTSAPMPAPKPQRRPRRVVKAHKAPLQEVQAAAWREPPQGELVDAPRVEPGRTITTEVQRRRRRFWRRAPDR